MNTSAQSEIFLATCHIQGNLFTFVRNLPSKAYAINQIFMIILNGILMFSTVLLNGIAVATVAKSHLRSKVCYFLILVQSAIDFSVGLITIPLFIAYLVSPFVAVEICPVNAVMTQTYFLPCVLSVITLSAMTMERYISVLYPYSYHSFVTKKRILAYVGGCGTVAVLVMALSFLIRTLLKILFAGALVLFFIFTAFAYTRIYLVVRRLSRPRNMLENEQIQDIGRWKAFQRQVKHAKSCFLVVVCFFIFLLPISIPPTIFNFSPINKMVEQSWSMTFLILNSSINSIIFYWTKSVLRKEAIKLLNSIWQEISG